MTTLTDRPHLRYILSAVIAGDALILSIGTHRAAAETGRQGAPGLESLIASMPCLVILTALSLAAVLLFAGRRSPRAAGLVALGTLAILEHAKASFTLAGHSRIFFAGGATLAGWVFGLAFGRRIRRDGDESLAEAGAIAGLAATYVDAGLSKLLNAGLSWADANSARVAVLIHHPIDDTSVLGAYARFVVENAAAARTLSIATLIFEVGAFAYLVGPRMRAIWGTFLLGFHVNVALVTQSIFYFQASILLVAFSYPWARRTAAAAPLPGDERTRAAATQAGAWVAAAVALAWLVRAFGGSVH